MFGCGEESSSRESIDSRSKKRFSFFKKNPVSDKNDDCENHQLLGDEGTSTIDKQREGGKQEEWFDIGVSFCSEMDLPQRDDVDPDVASEAQRILKEEGR